MSKRDLKNKEYYDILVSKIDLEDSVLDKPFLKLLAQELMQRKAFVSLILAGVEPALVFKFFKYIPYCCLDFDKLTASILEVEAVASKKDLKNYRKKLLNTLEQLSSLLRSPILKQIYSDEFHEEVISKNKDNDFYKRISLAFETKQGGFLETLSFPQRILFLTVIFSTLINFEEDLIKSNRKQWFSEEPDKYLHAESNRTNQIIRLMAHLMRKYLDEHYPKFIFDIMRSTHFKNKADIGANVTVPQIRKILQREKKGRTI